MSERKSVFYNLINSPIIYKLIQKLMSGTSIRADIIKKNIKKKNLKILDIGCGPAEILEIIPECEYYGYDVDKRSIDNAKKIYRNKKFHFINKKINKNEIRKLPQIDYVIFFGILHHLNDAEANNLIRLCTKKMKKGSKLITLDPIFTKNQNFIAKNLIRNDRGKNVREEKEYIILLKNYFNNVKTKITHQTFIPYTWFTTICRK